MMQSIKGRSGQWDRDLSDYPAEFIAAMMAGAKAGGIRLPFPHAKQAHSMRSSIVKMQASIRRRAVSMPAEIVQAAETVAWRVDLTPTGWALVGWPGRSDAADQAAEARERMAADERIAKVLESIRQTVIAKAVK